MPMFDSPFFVNGIQMLAVKGTVLSEDNKNSRKLVPC